MAFGQAAAGNVDDGTTISAQFGSTPTAGSTIVACVHIFNGTAAPTGNTVADDGSNTYTLLQGQSQNTNRTRMECFRAVNITGVASHDVTWTSNGGTVIDGTLTITEWTGTAASPVDQSNISTVGNVSTPTGTAITSGGAGMHVTFLGWDNFAVTHTAATGWTEAVETSRGGGFLSQAMSYRAAVNAVSQTPGATLSGNAAFGSFIHVTLLESSGGGGGGYVPRNCSLLGVCE